MAAVAEPPVEPHERHEHPARVVWALAWPAVALNSLQTVNTLLDRTFIGQLPQAALTGHGGAMNVMMLVFSLGISVATGATALVARAYGAEQPSEYRKASRQSLSITLAFSLILALVNCFGAHTFAGFLLPKDDPDAVRQMATFLVAWSVGIPALYVIQTLAGSLRGIGDTKSPMVISGIQILLHIVLNYSLIFPTHRVLGFMYPGLGLGLPGAALAQSISGSIAALIYLAYLPKTPLGSLWKIEWPNLGWAWRVLRIAIPAGVQAVLRVFSMMTFTLILALVPNGSVAIAAMTIAFSIEGIMYMPTFGLSAASGALVGQSLGMKRADRAERLAWTAGHHAALVTLALAGPLFVFAYPITAELLANKVDIVIEATRLLQYLCVTEVMFAYAMVMIGAMQGAGDTTRPLWITIFALWGLRVPLAFFLAIRTGAPLGGGLVNPIGLGLGPTGAWIAISASQAIQGILALALFRQGKWKTMKV